MNLEVRTVCDWERRREKKIERERKENPQWTLSVFRNSKPQQPAQGCKMHVTGMTGDPRVPLRTRQSPGEGWGKAEMGIQSQALRSCSSRALKTVHNLSSPIFKCSAERRLLF